jgi:hypothetical protein
LNAFEQLALAVRQVKKQTTQTACTALAAQLDALSTENENLAQLPVLINMMRSLCSYLSDRGEKAHPDALPVLDSLCKAACTLPALTGSDRSASTEVVKEQMVLYRELQNKLASNPQVAVSDIENLKAVILAIDWEISDENLNRFDQELSSQLERFKPYNIHYTLLQILNSTGRYVAAQKAKAHADSIYFLRSVFAGFESLIANPGMPLKEKKQVLEAELKKFNAFKAKVTQRQKTVQAELVPAPDQFQAVTPALSHLSKIPHKSASDEDAGTLTALDDADSYDARPAPVQKPPAQNGSGDVMDDLFSIKESPADELLDAIHLLDVHGGTQDQALSMLNATDGESSDEMKQFTPQRKDNEPIPEIGSRLDAFFNPSGTGSDAQAAARPEQEPEAPDTIEPEEMIPFDIADEVDEPENMAAHEEDDPSANDTGQILDRLQARFRDPDLFRESADSITQDLASLKTVWKLDAEKLSLVSIIETACILATPPEREPADAFSGESRETKGFWGKLKSLFSS